MKNFGLTIEAFLAAASLTVEALAQSILDNANAGRIVVADVLAQVASKSLIRQGFRAQNVDVPAWPMSFPMTNKPTKESTDSEGNTKTRITSGPSQFCLADHGLSVNYAPVMPSAAIYAATGNAFTKAYKPMYESDGTTIVDSKGIAHQFTTPAYHHLVPIQHALFASIFGIGKGKGKTQPFTVADIMAKLIVQHGKPDDSGRATVKFFGECLRDTMADLVKFGFLLASEGKALDSAYLVNPIVRDYRADAIAAMSDKSASSDTDESIVTAESIA